VVRTHLRRLGLGGRSFRGGCSGHDVGKVVFGKRGGEAEDVSRSNCNGFLYRLGLPRGCECVMTH
jgi:hypothetical protein